LLPKIFNKSIQLKYCPETFKQSIIVALRKLGKDDYTKPKAYWPIALINTLGKILDTVLARRIQYYAEKHHMLPKTHTGERKQTSCKHRIYLLFEKVYSAWQKNKVALLLLLDIAGAFDNVSYARLLYNIRKRGLLKEIVTWIASYLTGRKTKIKLFKDTSEYFDVSTGIP